MSKEKGNNFYFLTVFSRNKVYKSKCKMSENRILTKFDFVNDIGYLDIENRHHNGDHIQLYYSPFCEKNLLRYYEENEIEDNKCLYCKDETIGEITIPFNEFYSQLTNVNGETTCTAVLNNFNDSTLFLKFLNNIENNKLFKTDSLKYVLCDSSGNTIDDWYFEISNKNLSFNIKFLSSEDTSFWWLFKDGTDNYITINKPSPYQLKSFYSLKLGEHLNEELNFLSFTSDETPKIGSGFYLMGTIDPQYETLAITLMANGTLLYNQNTKQVYIPVSQTMFSEEVMNVESVEDIINAIQKGEFYSIKCANQINATYDYSFKIYNINNSLEIHFAVWSDNNIPIMNLIEFSYEVSFTERVGDYYDEVTDQEIYGYYDREYSGVEYIQGNGETTIEKQYKIVEFVEYIEGDIASDVYADIQATSDSFFKYNLKISV